VGIGPGNINPATDNCIEFAIDKRVVSLGFHVVLLLNRRADHAHREQKATASRHAVRWVTVLSEGLIRDVGELPTEMAKKNRPSEKGAAFRLWSLIAKLMMDDAYQRGLKILLG
jgi:hypothetical protein